MIKQIIFWTPILKRSPLRSGKSNSGCPRPDVVRIGGGRKKSEPVSKIRLDKFWLKSDSVQNFKKLTYSACGRRYFNNSNHPQANLKQVLPIE